MIHITKHSGLVFDTTNKDLPGVCLKFGNLSTRIQDVVIGKLSFLSRLIDRFSNRYVKLNADGKTYHVRVKNLAETLDVSQEKILKAKAEGSIERLLKTALEAKEYCISFSSLEDAKIRSPEGEVEYLESLADSLHIPLKSLLEAKEEGRLQEVLDQAQEVEKKTHETFSKIEKLYDEVDQGFVTKNVEESIQTTMPKEILQALKLTIRSAYKILESPGKNKREVEAIIEISPDYKVLVQVKGDTLKITSLFGKLLGHGQYGAVVKRINILNGKWEKGDEEVLKIPMRFVEAEEQLEQEVDIINSIHNGEKVLGSQKKLRIIRNVFKGNAKHCHLGSAYEGDLLNAINEKKIEKCSLSEKLSLGYEITHLLVMMHEKSITHGDIKPNNIFYDLSKKSPNSFRAFMADYGGAINHDKTPLTQHGTTTPEFRVLHDNKVSKLAYNSGDAIRLLDVEKKADVFATCASLYMLYTGELPYEGNPSRDQDFKIKDDLTKRLRAVGLSNNFIEQILLGLNEDYTKRPDAKTLFDAVRRNIINVDFERFQVLASLSSIKKNTTSHHGLYLEKKGKRVVI